MKNNDKGMRELVKLLKAHPDLMSALVFDPRSVRRVLKGKAARQLTLGVDTKAFLKYIAGPAPGGPIALCVQRTAQLCAKATICPGGTLPASTNALMRLCFPWPRTFPCRNATRTPCHWVPLTKV